MPTPRTLATLRRRLALAELDLLRQVVTDQAARIESLEAELSAAYRDADISQRNADVWQDMWADAVTRMESPPTLGLTQAGQVVMLSVQSTH